jgi:hypothetical protein
MGPAVLQPRQQPKLMSRFRNAALYGGEMTLRVMNRRADYWLSWPVFTQYLPRLAAPGAAV